MGAVVLPFLCSWIWTFLGSDTALRGPACSSDSGHSPACFVCLPQVADPQVSCQAGWQHRPEALPETINTNHSNVLLGVLMLRVFGRNKIGDHIRALLSSFPQRQSEMGLCLGFNRPQ